MNVSHHGNTQKFAERDEKTLIYLTYYRITSRYQEKAP